MDIAKINDVLFLDAIAAVDNGNVPALKDLITRHRSLDTVKLLIKAGARLDLTDKAYGGTPLGRAIYMQTGDVDEQHQKEYAVIEVYLSGLI